MNITQKQLYDDYIKTRSAGQALYTYGKYLGGKFIL